MRFWGAVFVPKKRGRERDIAYFVDIKSSTDIESATTDPTKAEIQTKNKTTIYC
jgi:hypothetical protein